MSNNYTQFAVLINLPSYEARVWALELFKQINDCIGNITDGVTKVPKIKDKAMSKIVHQLVLPHADRGTFEFESNDDDVQAGVIIFSDENTNLELVFDTIQAVLQHFRLNDIITMTWANTCSRNVCGEMGGGYAVISRQKIEVGDVHLLASNIKDKWLEQRKKGKRK